jgi:hypothetical protein
MIILDGAAIVHYLKPGAGDSFADYAKKIVNTIRSRFKGQVKRVDVVFDM